MSKFVFRVVLNISYVLLSIFQVVSEHYSLLKQLVLVLIFYFDFYYDSQHINLGQWRC